MQIGPISRRGTSYRNLVRGISRDKGRTESGTHGVSSRPVRVHFTNICNIESLETRFQASQCGPAHLSRQIGPAKVSHDSGRPDVYPRLNHDARCAAVPWVNDSGWMLPVSSC